MKVKSIISIHHLTKTYEGNVGVKDISFDVKQGEIFGFLGPNGAGKSTTIKMLLDLTKPDKGDIHIFGQDIKLKSLDIRKDIGYLPGDFQAFEGLTGLQFLNLTKKMKRESFEIDDWLAQLKLSPSVLNKKVSHYSQGMKQKLGLINAFATRPKLLILDEPSSALDPIIQSELYKILKEFADNGTTILFSSHNLSEVERICDRVAVIKEGKIVLVSTIKELRSKSFKKLVLHIHDAPDVIIIRGAKLIHQQNDEFIFQLFGNINDLLMDLQKLDITDMNISEPSLNEIFKTFY